VKEGSRTNVEFSERMMAQLEPLLKQLDRSAGQG
jgi:hypothetical protein